MRIEKLHLDCSALFHQASAVLRRSSDLFSAASFPAGALGFVRSLPWMADTPEAGSALSARNAVMNGSPMRPGIGCRQSFTDG